MFSKKIGAVGYAVIAGVGAFSLYKLTAQDSILKKLHDSEQQELADEISAAIRKEQYAIVERLVPKLSPEYDKAVLATVHASDTRTLAIFALNGAIMHEGVVAQLLAPLNPARAKREECSWQGSKAALAQLKEDCGCYR
jgi:hypothetical protein